MIEKVSVPVLSLSCSERLKSLSAKFLMFMSGTFSLAHLIFNKLIFHLNYCPVFFWFLFLFYIIIFFSVQ